MLRPCPSSAVRNCAGCRACAAMVLRMPLPERCPPAGDGRVSRRPAGFRQRFCAARSTSSLVIVRRTSASTKARRRFGRESFASGDAGPAPPRRAAATGLAAAPRIGFDDATAGPGRAPLRLYAHFAGEAPRRGDEAGVRPMRWGGAATVSAPRRATGALRAPTAPLGDRFTGRIDVADDVAGSSLPPATPCFTMPLASASTSGSSRSRADTAARLA